MSNELIYKGVNLNTTPNDASLVNYTDNKSIGASTVQEGLDVVASNLSNLILSKNTSFTYTNLICPGFITGSGKQIFLTMPLGKYASGSLTIDSLLITVRQNGNYIVGSSSTGSDVTSYITEKNLKYGGMLNLTITFDSMPSGATNNDSISVYINSITFNFS